MDVNAKYVDVNAGLETKALLAASPDEIEIAQDDLVRTFEAFKEANDVRLTAIEHRMADLLLEEKVDRINEALDRHIARIDSLKSSQRRLDDIELIRTPNQHRSAFAAYVRKGETSLLADFEQKALSVGADPDGGYLVPEETEREIGRLLRVASPIRSIAGARQISSAVHRKPFAIAGASAGWVGETATRAQTAAPSLAELQFPAMELYAMPAATKMFLDDASVDVERWLAEEVQSAFAEQETAAFVNGDGVNKPKGFLDYPKIADASWSWGKLGYIATGALGAFATTGPSDALINLVYGLKRGYCSNASFVMSRTTQSAVRKLKNSNGDYLWQPAIAADGRGSLMGFPVVEAEDMPAITADSYSIAFGDFRRGYLIVDRIGVRTLRDPYSAKPYVLFYTTKRVGGGAQNFEAIKLLKFGAE